MKYAHTHAEPGLPTRSKSIDTQAAGQRGCPKPTYVHTRTQTFTRKCTRTHTPTDQPETCLPKGTVADELDDLKVSIIGWTNRTLLAEERNERAEIATMALVFFGWHGD